MKLGQRLKRIRVHKDLTLRQLAQRSGLTISFLSQMERGLVSPSVESLRKLGESLGVKVGSFFDEDEGQELALIRKGQRRRAINAKTRAAVETLASGLLNIRIEPRLLILEGGGTISEEVNGRTTEAFGFVLDGKVEIVHGKEERVVMERGDSIYLKSPRVSRIVNVGSSKAELLWVVIGG